MSYVCWVQNSLQSVNTGKDTLALSGDTTPGGGGHVMAQLVSRDRLRCIKITGKIVISVMWNVESFTRQQRVILRQFLHVARNNSCWKQMDKYNSIPDIQRFRGGGGQRINKLVNFKITPFFFLLCLYVSKLLQDNCQIKIMLLHICSIIYCILHEVKLYSISKGHFLIKFA